MWQREDKCWVGAQTTRERTNLNVLSELGCCTAITQVLITDHCMMGSTHLSSKCIKDVPLVLNFVAETTFYPFQAVKFRKEQYRKLSSAERLVLCLKVSLAQGRIWFIIYFMCSVLVQSGINIHDECFCLLPCVFRSAGRILLRCGRKKDNLRRQWKLLPTWS